MINPTFIETYDNVLSKEKCNELIQMFDQLETRKRPDIARAYLDKEDTFSFGLPMDIQRIIQSEVILPCWKNYTNKYQIIKTHAQHAITDVKIQKTEPGEGYHIWHCEDGCIQHSVRIAVWTVYLNDIEDGGETEFLYQNQRYSPKAGRVVIFPASYTHVHRGNPPLKETKYILTGWIEFV